MTNSGFNGFLLILWWQPFKIRKKICRASSLSVRIEWVCSQPPPPPHPPNWWVNSFKQYWVFLPGGVNLLYAWVASWPPSCMWTKDRSTRRKHTFLILLSRKRCLLYTKSKDTSEYTVWRTHIYRIRLADLPEDDSRISPEMLVHSRALHYGVF